MKRIRKMKSVNRKKKSIEYNIEDLRRNNVLRLFIRLNLQLRRYLWQIN